ncbi:hypothetical protein EC988_002736 [Linderina pennispora]|nr:hypothetical protein EC988_002736 [Linderina pennispora]
MGFKYPHYLENDSKSARPSKRRRTTESFVTAPNEETPDAGTDGSLLDNLPPPIGYETLFNGWAKKLNMRPDYRHIEGDVLVAASAVRRAISDYQDLKAARITDLPVSVEENSKSIALLEREYERFDKRREMVMACLNDNPDAENLWKEIDKLDLKCESVQKFIKQEIESANQRAQQLQEDAQKAVDESIERVNMLLAISDGEPASITVASKCTSVKQSDSSTNCFANIHFFLQVDNLVLGPIEPLIAPQNTRPALRIVNSCLALPPIKHDAERRQNAIRLNHHLLETRPHLHTRRFALPHVPISQGFHPRILLNEHCMGKFFENEIFSRVLDLFPEVVHGASIEFVPGNPACHADYFAYLKANVKGRMLHTYIALEFKMPYRTRPQATGIRSGMGDPRVRVDEESGKALEDAGFASIVHGAKLIHQTYCYARDGRLACPQVPDPRLINRRFGYCSTFNESWVCEYIDSDIESQGSLAETQHTAVSTGSSDGIVDVQTTGSPAQATPACYINVSSCFHANNNSPHIAVVIVGMLSDAVRDMQDNPDQYMEMDQAVDKTNPLMSPPSHVSRTPYKSGTMAYSIPGKVHRKSLGRRSIPGNGSTTKGQDMTVLAVQCRQQTTFTFQPLFLYTDVWCGNVVVNQHAPEQTDMATDSTLQARQSTDGDCATQGIWAYVVENWRPLTGHFTLGRQLGYGRSGYVHEAWHNNRHVALKLCPLQTEDRILEEIVQETRVYAYLRDLQGTELPTLYNYGVLEINGVLYLALALEFLQDALQANTMTVYREHLVAALPSSVKSDILNSLAKLHQRGVVHNDPRVYNVLLVQDPARPDRYKPKLLDLAMSYIDATDEVIQEDKRLWTAVLNGEAI